MDLPDKFNMILEADQSGARLRVMRVSGTFSAPDPRQESIVDLLSKAINTDHRRLQITS